MRTSILAATLAAAVGVSGRAFPQELPEMPNAPLLPPKVFLDAPKIVMPVPFEVAAARISAAKATATASSTSSVAPSSPAKTLTSRATCGNIRVRQEWDSYSTNDRNAFISAIRCLMGRGPSGQFSGSRSRYEDLVALHQTLTPNVHGNDKFLIWHRYLTWVFEDVLRSECGFNRAMPWFDETKYAGRFTQSSLFSDQFFGSVDVGGQCVTNGAFANLAINIGPGPTNSRHCLARNNNDSATSNCNSGYVDTCNRAPDYSSMRQCSEGGPHAWGHNGIGSVMSDVYASPADPVFWMHHAFIDRNYRIWQNQNSARANSISGTDHSGNALTMNTIVNVMGMRPDVRIGDILDTTGTTLCYKYSY